MMGTAIDLWCVVRWMEMAYASARRYLSNLVGPSEDVRDKNKKKKKTLALSSFFSHHAFVKKTYSAKIGNGY